MTLIDKAEALLPCPFCGGEARKWQDPSHSAAWFIGCDDGDRDCFGSIHWAETEAEAIAAWNRRHTSGKGGVMAQRWEQMAEAAGFRKASQLTTSTTTEAYGEMRLVGPPTMPEGYAAIVGKTGVVILGPNPMHFSGARRR